MLCDDDECELIGDALSFHYLLNAMRVYGFDDDEAPGSFAIFASILHTCILSFVTGVAELFNFFVAWWQKGKLSMMYIPGESRWKFI